MRRQRQIRWWILGLLVGLCIVNTAFALDPTKTVSQYVHDRWGADEGFLGGSAFSICQSDDGYLWIGTERGLVRFDGIDFTLIQYPISHTSPVGAVRGLVSDSGGNMWVRLDGPNLLVYRKGRFEDAMARFALQEVTFTSMSLDVDGKLLLWGPQSRLLRFIDGAFHRYDVTPDIPGIVISAVETPNRKIWMGTRDIGLFQVDRGRSSNLSGELAPTSLNSLLPANDQRMWIGTDTGLELWAAGGSAEPNALLMLKKRQILASIKDRDGNIWVGTDHGLTRISPDLRVSDYLPDAPANTDVTTVYEDRDGDIWFAGPRGVERLRDGMFTGYATTEGVPPINNGPVYADSDGRTWFAPSTGGLFWLKDRQVHKVTVAGLDRDVVYSISGGGGEIWLGRQHDGLTVLTSKGATFAARTFTQTEGLAQDSIYSVHRNHDGTVWAGSISDGVSRFSRGVFTNYSVGNGLSSAAVFSIAEGYDGTVWFATPSGVESYKQGVWKTFAITGSVPSSSVRSVFEDSKHLLWVGTSRGLAFLSTSGMVVPLPLTDSLREEILGITEDKQGSLWIVTSDHILQVSRDRLLDRTLTDLHVRSYGTEDGLPGMQGVRRDRSVVADLDGRIWISLAQGLAVANPARAARNAVPVRVRIESLSTASGPVAIEGSPKLDAGARSITFRYSGTDLATPQRVVFRYKLDGSDQDWSQDVARHEVSYENLGPGPYTFHVLASNDAGQWDGPETTLGFTVEPHFWQTWWYRILCLGAAILLVMLFYRMRMFQLTKRLNLRFQDRLSERTRIAQDLHDTLLQGVLSASLQLDLVEDQTPDDSPTKPMLRRILQLMGQVTEEGKSALRGLRAPATEVLSLETSLSRLRDEIVFDQNPSYQVLSRGDSRPLRPMAREEIYRIGREAVVNAFRHAKANNIEVEVVYASKFLKIFVRDDGCGMEPQVLQTGREGHWGLVGMRERSTAIGASLRLRSRVGAGTEVELTLPNTLSFEGAPRGALFFWRSLVARESFDLEGQSNKKRDRP